MNKDFTDLMKSYLQSSEENLINDFKLSIGNLSYKAYRCSCLIVDKIEQQWIEFYVNNMVCIDEVLNEVDFIKKSRELFYEFFEDENKFIQINCNTKYIRDEVYLCELAKEMYKYIRLDLLGKYRKEVNSYIYNELDLWEKKVIQGINKLW